MVNKVYNKQVSIEEFERNKEIMALNRQLLQLKSMTPHLKLNNHQKTSSQINLNHI